MTITLDRPLSIAIGVNGIGMGHASRQAALAQHLKQRGHQVQFITTGAAEGHLRELGYTVHQAWMPTLIASRGRVRFWSALSANLRHVPRGVARYRAMVSEFERTGIPDAFISDYEPMAARLAYRFDRPLFSVDQQSKFRFLDLPDIGEFTAVADRQRLGWFVPRAARTFICSFVPLESPDSSIDIIPPLIADDVWACETTTEPLITAYFSRYFGYGPQASARELARIVETDLGGTALRLYAHPGDAQELADLNSADGRIAVRPFSRGEFLSDLARSQCLIANAGFNLIAEAALLAKPLLVLPLPTYDQQWCAATVADCGLGMAAPSVTREAVLSLIEKCEEIAEQLTVHRAEFLGRDVRRLIGDCVESVCTRSRAAVRG